MQNSQHKQAWLSSVGGILLLLAAIFSINVIASRFYVRMDMTQDKIFTLSEGTRAIISELPRNIDVRLYFSRSIKELPVPIKTYATRVEEVLHEYAALSSGKLTVEVIDPKPDTDDEEWARRFGLRGARMPSGNEMYFGVVFLAGNNELAIPYLDPRREEFLEYDLSEAIIRLTAERKLKVGLYSSLPVSGFSAQVPMQVAQPNQGWVFVEQLKRNYDLEVYTPDTTSISDNTDVIILFHPKDISDSLKFAVDQFVLRGGRVIAIVDPFSRHELAMGGQNAFMGGQIPSTSSNLEELFAAWDVVYNDSELVGDRDYMLQVNVGGAVVPYPFFMGLQGDAINRESVITSRLNQLLVAEGGSFQMKDDTEYLFQPLLSTSKQSGKASAHLASFMEPSNFVSEMRLDEQHHTIAGLIQGRFRSAFEDKLPDGLAEEQAANFISEAEREGVVLVIADTDMFVDDHAVDQIRFGPQVIIRPRNDNLNLLFNAVEFLGGSENLIAIRSRGRIARPFTKVQEIQAQAQQRWQEEEQRLSQQISELQKRLNELQSERASGSRFMISSQQQSEIERFRQQESDARRRRREVRRNLREDIERLGTRLVAANMLIVPLLVGGFGAGVFFRRTSRMRRKV